MAGSVEISSACASSAGIGIEKNTWAARREDMVYYARAMCLLGLRCMMCVFWDARIFRL